MFSISVVCESLLSVLFCVCRLLFPFTIHPSQNISESYGFLLRCHSVTQGSCSLMDRMTSWKMYFSQIATRLSVNQTTPFTACLDDEHGLHVCPTALQSNQLISIWKIERRGVTYSCDGKGQWWFEQ